MPMVPGERERVELQVRGGRAPALYHAAHARIERVRRGHFGQEAQQGRRVVQAAEDVLRAGERPDIGPHAPFREQVGKNSVA